MTFSIVTLKAFGDFVIACHSARAARMQSPVAIHHPAVIAGEYMRPLAAALGVESEVAFIGSKQWTDVPAVFDVRKRGIIPALHSLIELRAILKKFPQDREFVFDNAGIREFFLCPHRKLHHIPKASGNIYLGYQQFFQSAPKPASHPFSFTSVKKVILIPGQGSHPRLFQNLLLIRFTIYWQSVVIRSRWLRWKVRALIFQKVYTACVFPEHLII